MDESRAEQERTRQEDKTSRSRASMANSRTKRALALEGVSSLPEVCDAFERETECQHYSNVAGALITHVHIITQASPAAAHYAHCVKPASLNPCSKSAMMSLTRDCQRPTHDLGVVKCPHSMCSIPTETRTRSGRAPSGLDLLFAGELAVRRRGGVDDELRERLVSSPQPLQDAD